MKAYLVMVTENCTSYWRSCIRGEEITKTRIYRAFTDKQKANDCIKNITLKDIFGDPDLPWPEDQIEITYDNYLLDRDIDFKVANYDKKFWCHCEIDELEIG